MLIWKLRQSHGSRSSLGHKAHDGVCNFNFERPLEQDTGRWNVSLRQPYSVTVPASDGRLTAENIRIGCGEECLNSLCTFPLCLSEAGGLVGGAQMWRSRVLQALRGVRVCVECCKKGEPEKLWKKKLCFLFLFLTKQCVEF